MPVFYCIKSLPKLAEPFLCSCDEWPCEWQSESLLKGICVNSPRMSHMQCHRSMFVEVSLWLRYGMLLYEVLSHWATETRIKETADSCPSEMNARPLLWTLHVESSLDSLMTWLWSCYEHAEHGMRGSIFGNSFSFLFFLFLSFLFFSFLFFHFCFFFFLFCQAISSMSVIQHQTQPNRLAVKMKMCQIVCHPLWNRCSS